ncbi:trigger factor [Eubacteriales bacterium OttesenSCG-928-M02]|nr:trigger factor [Eubacteriales bacterium OttesenSCG-928-M02]
MASTMEKLEKSTVKLEVTVGAVEFSLALQNAYQRTRGRYTVQGFRKGKAPRNLIERYYGDNVFYEDAIEEVWPKAFSDAVEEHGLDIVSRPQITITQVGEGQPLIFTAVCAVYPEVTLGKYKGVEVERIVPTVTEEQVQQVIDNEGAKLIRYIEVDRPIQMGDRITFDYKGKVGEDYFEGGEAENAQLDIGGGQFIPGFEEAMVGIPKGEHREIPVTFPTEYHAEDLAGKDAIFEVMVHDIREAEYPVLDDEFAKDVSDFDTMEEWKQDIKDKMMEEAERSAKATMQNAILEKIAQDSTFDVPDMMVEGQIDRTIQNLAYRLQESGIPLEMYLQYTGLSMDALRDQYREESAKRVTNQIVLDEITKAENLTASEEELDQKLSEYAAQIDATLEEYKQNLTEDDRRYFMEDVAIDKTLDFILNNAKIVDKLEEKPKKKAAAKKAPAKKKADAAETDGAEEAAKEEPKKKAPAKKAAAKKAEKPEDDGGEEEKKPAPKKKAPAKKAAEKANDGEEKPKRTRKPKAAEEDTEGN